MMELPDTQRDYLHPGTQLPGPKDTEYFLASIKRLMLSRPFTSFVYFLMNNFGRNMDIDDSVIQTNSLELHEMELSSGHIIKHPY